MDEQLKLVKEEIQSLMAWRGAESPLWDALDKAVEQIEAVIAKREAKAA